MLTLTMNLSSNISQNAVTFIDKLQQYYATYPETNEIQYTVCLQRKEKNSSDQLEQMFT